MLTQKTIEDKLHYLHSRLPKHPTSVEGPYLLPKHIRKKVFNSDFSQTSLQKVSDHIGFFLGLLNSIKVKICIETSEYMLSKMSPSKDSNYVGLYKAIGGSVPEIQLTKKVRFELSHILAILAHESTHNYLSHHGIHQTCESENEIITDLAGVYLGLGGLLLRGYKPIRWISDEWHGLASSGHTEHTIKIGYITPENIRYAIFSAVKIRGLKPLALPLPLIDRVRLHLHFRGIENREAKRKKEIESLVVELKKAESLYNSIQSQIEKASKTQTKMTSEDAHKLVEIANALASGEAKLQITKLLRDAETLRSLSEAECSHISVFSSQVSSTLKTVSDWQKVISKYIT